MYEGEADAHGPRSDRPRIADTGRLDPRLRPSRAAAPGLAGARFAGTDWPATRIATQIRGIKLTLAANRDLGL